MMYDMTVFSADWSLNMVFLHVVLIFYLFLMTKVGSKV